MKKNYIAPVMNLMHISQELPIAASDPVVSINREVSVGAANVEVKENSYSVWDDDWSK